MENVGSDRTIGSLGEMRVVSFIFIGRSFLVSLFMNGWEKR